MYRFRNFVSRSKLSKWSIQNPHQPSHLGVSLSTTKFFTTMNMDSKIPTKVHLTLFSVIFGTLPFAINNSKRTLPLKYQEQILLPAEERDKHIGKHSGEPFFTNISEPYDCQNKMLLDLDNSEEMWTTWEEERQELNIGEFLKAEHFLSRLSQEERKNYGMKLWPWIAESQNGNAHRLDLPILIKQVIKSKDLNCGLIFEALFGISQEEVQVLLKMDERCVKRLGQSCEESYIEDNFQPAESNHSETIAEDWRERAILSGFGAVQGKAKQDSADAETNSK
ncbi:hypothetical protein BHYA_0202g00100 [Botrytis hyacinthi]|uniref:Uncharacterized protein n=1 Tax=Botrytis hyacinthi TaxID=278943 RepID=A0A4Z1GBI3_9HELO|nr:hypothetical protein BHYA_0202g00100 [Botrytis hyacinthi]